MEKELKKTKKEIKENEASILRWLATVVIGFVLGSVIGTIFQIIIEKIPTISEGGSWDVMHNIISLMLYFACLFWGMVIAIKTVAKTSIKSFILGADRTTKVDIKKEVLPIAGLFFVGILITTIPSIKNISVNNITMAQIVFIIIFCLMFTWMQTSWEEFVFRGITLRITCKNDIEFTKKSIIGCVISSLLFMALHIGNPEVLHLSGIDAVFMVLSYLVPGVLLYVVDVMCKNILPGMIIHFVNNFFAFVFVSEAVSAGGATSIWIDHSSKPGILSFIAVIISYVPVLIYLIIKRNKK